MAKEKGRTYAQLTPEGVAALNRFYDKMPLKKEWFPIMRARYGRSARENNWNPMLCGQSVPWAMLDAFAKEMAKRTDKQLDLHPFIEDAPRPCEPCQEDLPRVNAWTAGVRGMLGAVRGRMLAPEEAFCLTAEEVKQASLSVVRSVARDSVKRGVVLSEQEQLRIGSAIMKWDVDEYVDFMRRWWNRQPLVMMSPPSGVCAVLPLTPEAAERFRRGQVNDHELSPETDYAFPSRHLLILSGNDKERPPGMNARRAAWEMFRSMMTQVAMFSHPEPHAEEGMHFVSFCGTPDNGRRLQNYGFVWTGAKMPRIGVDLMEVRRPEKSHKDYIQHMLTYESLVHLVRIWQIVSGPNPTKEE